MKKIVIYIILLLGCTNKIDFRVMEKYMIFDKKISAGYDFKFYNETDSIGKEYRWTSLLVNKSNNIDTLEVFRYNFDDIPIIKTPDVWEESIYMLFSALDAMLLNKDELIVLYDKFGEIGMKIYEIGDKEKESTTVIPIIKYNMSFLHGYGISYGKIIKIGNELFVYYSAAAPPRENLIKMSLQSNKLSSIKFDEKKKIISEDNNRFFQQIFEGTDINEVLIVKVNELSHKIYGIKGKIDYLSCIRDVEASKIDMRLGTLYVFVKINNQTAIIQYDISNNQWIISDYKEQNIEN